jgi:hypothetical protein
VESLPIDYNSVSFTGQVSRKKEKPPGWRAACLSKRKEIRHPDGAMKKKK